jgi:ABC-type branched-subunit amino acid transport system substrate-binding protein
VCVTSTTITIGIHAPVTGAAPIKADAFNYGKDLYWNWLKHQGKSIYGRSVKFVFADDHYNPQTAAAVCEQMATQQHAFLLIGAAGTDQISQCAFYANQHGIPYLSAGVTKSGTNYPTYFGITMTYSDQMPLLAQYVKKLGAGEDRYGANGLTKDNAIKVAMVAPDTPNFADARDAMVAAFTRLGAPYQIRVYPVQKDENPQDSAGVIAQIKQWGADIISPITAPVFTIALSNASASQQYFPRYVGVGVTNAINQAISNECTSNQFGGPGTGKPAAMFFSPFPGWAQRNQFDPDYDKAVALAGSGAQNINQKGNGGDLMWSLWGVSKGLYQMLLAAGPNLTRTGFMNTLSTYSTHGTWHDFPNLTFTRSNRWGAYQVNALTADCANKEWVEDPNNFGLHSSF